MVTDIPHIMVISTRYYPSVSNLLLKGALEELDHARMTYEQLVVPGVLEIPPAMQFAIRSLDFSSARRRFDGYIALGCVLGDDDMPGVIVCAEALRGFQDLVLRYTLASGCGLLYASTEDKAMEMADSKKGNIGGKAVEICLDMIDMKRMLRLFPRVN